MKQEHQECPFAITNVGSGDLHRMWQPLRVDGNVPFYAGHFFAGVIPFLLRCVGILHALCADDAKRRLFGAPSRDTLVDDLIF